MQQYKNLTYGVQQGFWTGTTVSLGLSSVFGYNQNATTALFNPISTGSLSLSITQNLLNGFGLAVNKRAYHKAKNNLRSNDLSFENQVIATVANVVNLYYDLVTFNDELKVSQETLRLDTQLYEDTKKRAELGALAPIDIIQSEADMKAAQQDVVQRESQLLQQEMILKSVLTRNGLDDTTIALARVVPTDHVDVPAQEPVIPIQDLVTEAIAHRPEIEQNQIALENARLDLLGTKNNLLPSLQFSAQMSNAGQGGTLNPNVQVPVYGAGNNIVGYRPLGPQDVSSIIIGGYGTALGQIFSRNFPNYNFQLQLTVPIKNRANQADQITNELQYRQQQIQDKQLHNNIKLAVMNDWTSQRNSRAAYDTAVAARKLSDADAGRHPPQIRAGHRHHPGRGYRPAGRYHAAPVRSGCAQPVAARADKLAARSGPHSGCVQRGHRRSQDRHYQAPAGSDSGDPEPAQRRHPAERSEAAASASFHPGEAESVHRTGRCLSHRPRRPDLKAGGCKPSLARYAPLVFWKLAKIYPFQPYRYTARAGPLSDLVTQPYDKISPAMQAQYLAKSPYNLVRVVLGPRAGEDSSTDNVYTRAAAFLNQWIASGILAREEDAAVFPYFQEFTVPDTGERMVRKGFIALGAVEDYSARIVHRHEQTLSGPKKDRLELLRHTHAHFGQLFMLYPDPDRRHRCAAGPGCRHRRPWPRSPTSTA